MATVVYEGQSGGSGYDRFADAFNKAYIRESEPEMLNQRLRMQAIKKLMNDQGMDFGTAQGEFGMQLDPYKRQQLKDLEQAYEWNPKLWESNIGLQGAQTGNVQEETRLMEPIHEEKRRYNDLWAAQQRLDAIIKRTGQVEQDVRENEERDIEIAKILQNTDKEINDRLPKAYGEDDKAEVLFQGAQQKMGVFGPLLDQYSPAQQKRVIDSTLQNAFGALEKFPKDPVRQQKYWIQTKDMFKPFRGDPEKGWIWEAFLARTNELTPAQEKADFLDWVGLTTPLTWTPNTGVE